MMGIEIADNVARQGFGVVYHTLEMAAAQVTARVIASPLERKRVTLTYGQILRKRHLGMVEATEIANVAHELRGDPSGLRMLGA